MRLGQRVRPRPREATEPEDTAPVEWATFIGNYGDCISALGNLQEWLRQNGRDDLGVLYYGRFKAMPEFLARQQGVREVRAIIETDQAAYQHWAGMACNWTVWRRPWLTWMAREVGLEPSGFIFCQPKNKDDDPVYRPAPLVLGDEAREWAAGVLPAAGETFLLSPISVASCPLRLHWPYWEGACEWLLNETGWRFILTGTEPCGVAVPRSSLDLIGKTPSMEHVLALSERCRGVIGTTNSLSMWTVTQELPGLFYCNRNMHLVPYFLNWVNVPPNRLVNYSDDLETFKRAFNALCAAAPGSPG